MKSERISFDDEEIDPFAPRQEPRPGGPLARRYETIGRLKELLRAALEDKPGWRDEARFELAGED